VTAAPEKEVPQRDCIFCAGTGKIPDRPVSPSAFGAPTSFVIDPDALKDFKVLYGT
jgi:hypothetical protein